MFVGSRQDAAAAGNFRSRLDSADQRAAPSHDASPLDGGPLASRAAAEVAASAVAWIERGKSASRYRASLAEQDGGRGAPTELRPPLRPRRGERASTRRKGGRRPCPGGAGLCASDPCTDDIRRRTAAADPGSRAACRFAERAARRQGQRHGSAGGASRFSPDRSGKHFLLSLVNIG